MHSLLFFPPCFSLVAMKLDNGNAEFPRLITWFPGTGIPGIEFYTYCPVLVKLLAQICILGLATWDFKKWSCIAVEKVSTPNTVSTICCATPSPKHISGKGFSAAWQLISKNEPYFYNRELWCGCWWGMPYLPPCHRDVCQPGWALFVGNDGWGSFPSQFVVPGWSTRAVSR